MNALPILIRREFWEHRMLWIAPLVLVGIYFCLCFVPGPGVIGIPRGVHIPDLGPERSVVAFLGVQVAFTGFLILLMGAVVFFYLADCLYAERKDRSILFWKSLPVSDWITVLSKALVALVVMPVAICALALVANLIAYGILWIRFHDTMVMPNFIRWDTVAWLRLYGSLFANIIVLSLWYLPIVGYQLLLSAWARSAVLVWTLLPPFAVLLAEGWFLKSWNIAHFLGYRLLWGMWEDRPPPNFEVAPGAHNTIENVLRGTNLLPALGNIDLWLGVAVGVVLVLAAIRIRRYRDDS
jgi:ABC-2 type transport system permease protein